jgi:hypothetical protein
MQQWQVEGRPVAYWQSRQAYQTSWRDGRMQKTATQIVRLYIGKLLFCQFSEMIDRWNLVKIDRQVSPGYFHLVTFTWLLRLASFWAFSTWVSTWLSPRLQQTRCNIP